MHARGWVSVSLLVVFTLHLMGLPLAVTEPPAEGLKLHLRTDVKVQEVSPAFLSITIDASLVTDPRYITFLGSQRLRTLARGLSPAYLRFGGTKTDFLIFDPKKESTFEEKSYWEAQINPDTCSLGPIPSAVKGHLELEWPIQEVLLLKEQQQNKFENGTFTSLSLEHFLDHGGGGLVEKLTVLNGTLLSQLSPSQEGFSILTHYNPLIGCRHYGSQKHVEDLERTKRPRRLGSASLPFSSLSPGHHTYSYSESTVDMLYSFAKCSGLDLIFGINALTRTSNLQWDSSNAKLFLDYCTSQKYDIFWELGNEPNSFRKKSGIYINGSQLGKDFVKFHSLLKTYFKNTKLFGPDISQLRKNNEKMLRSFLNVGGGVIDAITWHHYYLDGRNATQEDFLNPEVLDTFIFSVQKVFQVVNETRPGKKVWLGETSSAYGGGAPKLSDTYTAGFMWLDKLGLSAKMGIDVVMRQVFFGAGNYHLVDGNFDPLPDYWLSLLFKQLVGTKVLTASVKSPDKEKLRLYLHCTNNNHPKYKEGDLTLYALNLHNDTKYLQLPPHLSGKRVEKYILQPSGYKNLLSQSVKLNGHILKMVDDKTLPELTGKPLCLGCPLTLPPFSYGFFVVLNAKVVTCI
ncbi:heparanase isoform X1 [Petaurus breviceps papuanus]|uniref:heparanase isoform X1 n=1 Tax=Petaurus breviceps papuanus TaxID=3040969 RepID=UPI0036DE1732